MKVKFDIVHVTDLYIILLYYHLSEMYLSEEKIFLDEYLHVLDKK